MYCPNCGQQQISQEMRFCSRCGLALSELAEWLAGGVLPVRQAASTPTAPESPRQRNIRRASKLMFFSGVLFPLFLVIGIAVEEAGPIVPPLLVFFASAVWMLYAKLFSYSTPPTLAEMAQPPTFASPTTRSALPPPISVPVPNVGRQRVRTNELAQPPSVTENTTRLLDNE
jgi:hypothetical protein